MRSLHASGAVRLVLIGFAMSMSAQLACAADKPFAAPQLNHTPASPAGGLAQVTLSLLLVLAAIFAAAWTVRRLRGVGQRGAETLRIVADLSLGPKERAVLIQVGQQQLLVGVAPGQVTTLHVLPESVATEQTAPTSPPANSSSTPAVPADAFKAILKRSLGL
jgi:flagellar protein FliO/FliZ